MNILSSSLYAAVIMGCVLCSFVIRTSSAPRMPRWYLTAYLVLQSGAFAFQWLMLHPTSPGKSLWLGSLMSLSLLLAPCLWLYAREITESQRPTVRSMSGLQIAAIACGMLLTLPLIQRAHLGPDYADPRHVATKTESLFIHGTMLASILVFLVQVPFYANACRRILRVHAGDSFAWFRTLESRPLDTLRVLVLLLATTWLVGLLRTLHCLILGKDTGLGLVFTGIEVSATLWGIFTLVRAHLEFAAPVPAHNETSTSERSAKYAKSSLDRTTRQRIQRKLSEQMRDARLYSDSTLSLRKLCEELRENPHYVSQVINQDLATNFNDLVNRHRIEAAKSALLASPEKTVLAICMEMGFNSKSTFNAAFRQYTGMTPTEYRRHMTNAEACVLSAQSESTTQRPEALSPTAPTGDRSTAALGADGVSVISPGGGGSSFAVNAATFTTAGSSRSLM